MFRFIMFMLLLIMPYQLNAQIINNVINSVVMVDYDDRNNGTAFTINEDDDNYYLITAGHVIHYGSGGNSYTNNDTEPVVIVDISNKKFDLTLFHSGTKQKFENIIEVLTYTYDGRDSYHMEDFALLKVSKSKIKDYKPLDVLNLSSEESDTEEGNNIWTYGSKNRGWPTLYKGRILPPNKIKGSLVFYPPCLPGRSGSPIMSEDLKRVIGMVVYTNNLLYTNGTIGPAVDSGAVPTLKIKKFLNNYYKSLEKGVENG